MANVEFVYMRVSRESGAEKYFMVEAFDHESLGEVVCHVSVMLAGCDLGRCGVLQELRIFRNWDSHLLQYLTLSERKIPPAHE